MLIGVDSIAFESERMNSIAFESTTMLVGVDSIAIESERMDSIAF